MRPVASGLPTGMGECSCGAPLTKAPELVLTIGTTGSSNGLRQTRAWCQAVAVLTAVVAAVTELGDLRRLGVVENGTVVEGEDPLAVVLLDLNHSTTAVGWAGMRKSEAEPTRSTKQQRHASGRAHQREAKLAVVGEILVWDLLHLAEAVPVCESSSGSGSA